jgi:hypothetical protein
MKLNNTQQQLIIENDEIRYLKKPRYNTNTAVTAPCVEIIKDQKEVV